MAYVRVEDNFLLILGPTLAAVVLVSFLLPNKFPRSSRLKRTFFRAFIVCSFSLFAAALFSSVGAILYGNFTWRIPHDNSWGLQRSTTAMFWSVQSGVSVLAVSLVAFCLRRAVRAERLGGPSILNKMVATIIFVLLCVVSASALFAPSVQREKSDLTIVTADLMVSGADRVDVTMRVGGVNSGRSLGDDSRQQLTFTVDLQGAPGTVARVALRADAFPADRALRTIRYTDLSVRSDADGLVGLSHKARGDETALFYGREDGGRCTGLSENGVDLIQAIGGSTTIGDKGLAKASFTLSGLFRWVKDTGGGKSSLRLPSLTIPVAVPGRCVRGTGVLIGPWELPSAATATITAGDEPLPLDSQVFASPPLASAANLTGSLRWHASSDLTGFRPAAVVELWPSVVLQTPSGMQAVNASLFMAALFAGGALSGIFEIVREWPSLTPPPQRRVRRRVLRPRIRARQQRGIRP